MHGGRRGCRRCPRDDIRAPPLPLADVPAGAHQGKHRRRSCTGEEPAMKEPYLTRFKQLILSGSASRDIHDAGDGPGAPGRGGERASAAFLMREVDRVRMHTAGLCVLLADHIATAAMVLDVGCGTGGTTVALALSALAPKQVIGVDADVSTLEAAEVRALGHDLEPQKVSFQHVPAGEPLPFAS
ncbi:MAG: class I SAM-dependent methyltransferase, partial [Pseudoxanthomonas sp.]